MKRIKVLVVEDEVIIADSICYALEKLGYEALEPALNYNEGVQLLEEEAPDMVILDIQLKGGKDGIDLAQTINEHYDLPFIFLTSNSDAATVARAKATRPSSYLIKPFSDPELYAAIEIALSNFSQKIDAESTTSRAEKSDFISQKKGLIIKDALFIKEKGLYFKVQFRDILYVKSDHVYLEVFTKNRRKYVMRAALSDMEKRLPEHFFRVHRSYIANLEYLEAINSAYILIQGDEKVPIGRSYREALMAKIDIAT